MILHRHRYSAYLHSAKYATCKGQGFTCGNRVAVHFRLACLQTRIEINKRPERKISFPLF